MSKNCPIRCPIFGPRLWWFAGIALFAGIVLQQWANRPVASPVTQAATILSTPRSIQPFQLQDHHGQSFSHAQLKNKWTLLFFGFTRCRGLCPKVMTELKSTYEQLPSSLQKQLQIALVSIDPARDDLPSLATFVNAFNEDFLGVRGETAAIKALTKELGIVYMETTDEQGEYDIDHSGTLLLFNPKGQLHALFSMPHEGTVIASDLQVILKH